MSRKVRSLKAFRDKKYGWVTPETILEELTELVEGGKIEGIVYIAFDEDQVGWVGWNGDPIEALGLLDYARAVILDDILDDARE